ncbi:hypothetical protein BB561_000140 [Smittium simulii]|uniref:Uncharacterized protein n=1 Tax=Smittium simulii TaxID=133385 RepID=A0A2T9Z0C4_9FUNG|nr:hypothetical protein BB561_000140 [Smittium simulii]
MPAKCDNDVFEVRRRTIAAPLKTTASKKNMRREYLAACKNSSLKYKNSQNLKPETSLLKDSPGGINPISLSTSSNNDSKVPSNDNWETFINSSISLDNQWYSTEAKSIYYDPKNKESNSEPNKSSHMPDFDNIQIDQLKKTWKKQFLTPVIGQLDSFKLENELLSGNLDSHLKELSEIKNDLFLKNAELEALNKKYKIILSDFDRIAEERNAKAEELEALQKQIKEFQTNTSLKDKNISSNWKLREEIWENIKKGQDYCNWKVFSLNIPNITNNTSQALSTSIKHTQSLSKLKNISSDDSNAIWITQVHDYTQLLESTTHLFFAFNANKKRNSELLAEIDGLKSSKGLILKDLEELVLEKKKVDQLFLDETTSHAQTREFLSAAQTKIEELELIALDKCSECYKKSFPEEANFVNTTDLLGELDKKRHDAELKYNSLKNENMKLKLYLRKNISNQENIKQQLISQKAETTNENYAAKIKKIENDLLQSEQDKKNLHERINELCSLLNNLTSSNSTNIDLHNLQKKTATFKINSTNSERYLHNIETQNFALQMSIKQLNSLNIKSNQELKTATLLKAKESTLNRSLSNQISEKNDMINKLKCTIADLRLKIENKEIMKQLEAADFDLLQSHPLQDIKPESKGMYNNQEKVKHTLDDQPRGISKNYFDFNSVLPEALNLSLNKPNSKNTKNFNIIKSTQNPTITSKKNIAINELYEQDSNRVNIGKSATSSEKNKKLLGEPKNNTVKTTTSINKTPNTHTHSPPRVKNTPVYPSFKDPIAAYTERMNNNGLSNDANSSPESIKQKDKKKANKNPQITNIKKILQFSDEVEKIDISENQLPEFYIENYEPIYANKKFDFLKKPPKTIVFCAPVVKNELSVSSSVATATSVVDFEQPLY